MPTIKRQNADGTWEYIQTTGLDVSQINSEITTARGTSVNLNERLNGVDSQLAENTKHLPQQLNVTQFDVKSDGVTNNTTALQNLINYAQSMGISSLYFPNGSYVWSNVLVTSTMSFVLAPDVTFIRANGSVGELITVNYYSTDIFTVSAVSNTSSTSLITLNDVTGLKRGDILKVYSDDIIPNVNGKAKNGEFKTIHDVNTSTKQVTLGMPFRYTYSTNVKAVKVSDNQFSINDVKLTTLSQPSGEDATALLGIYGGKYHNIKNPRVLSFDGTGILFIGSYGYNVENAISEYQKNKDEYQDGTNKIGYAVKDVSGGFYRVSFMTGNVRHGFDCNGSWNPTNGEAYGLSEFGDVHDSISGGGSYSSINAHEGSYNIKYSNIKIANCWSFGITMRGYNHVISDCEVYGYNGLNGANYITDGANYTSVNGTYIIKNCVISASNLITDINGVGNTLTFVFENCRIVGGGIVKSNNANLIFNNCYMDVGQIQLLGGGSIEFNNCPYIGVLNIQLKNGATFKANKSKIYVSSLSMIYPSGTLAVSVTLHDSIVSWEKYTGASGRFSIVETTDTNSTTMDVAMEFISTTILGLENKTIYFYYAGGTVNSVAINGWGMFIKPLTGLVFTKIPTWIANGSVPNLTYVSGSVQST